MRDSNIVSSVFQIDGETASFLTKVNHLLNKSGVNGYLVGGFLRDSLLGRNTRDIDIAITGNALDVALQLARELDGKYVLLDEPNQVARIVMPLQKIHIDFSAFQGETIEADLGRRDFTINAMAAGLEKALRGNTQVIDPFGGLNDLKIKCLRMVKNDVFQQDPVRLLRAIRFAAELDFVIEPLTEDKIKSCSALISLTAGERIQEELCNLLATKRSANYLRYMERLGLLLTIFPELSAAKGFEQPKEHYWDVLEHSLSTVEGVEFVLKESPWCYVNQSALGTSPWSEKLEDYFNEEIGGGHNRRVLLKLSALLHDVSKPETRSVQENGRIRFLGHGQLGAVLAAGMLKRLRFSSREIKLVATIVEHHLRPGQMRGEGLPTHRAIYRFFRDTGEAAVDTLFVSLADHLASRGPTLDVEQWKEHNLLVSFVLAEREREANLVKPQKLISGNDLITIFKLQPGPELGRILETVREAQAAGEVNNREEALSLAGKLVDRKRSGVTNAEME